MTQKTVSILGLLGSPRRNGNTETIAREMLRGAESAGAVSETVFLPELTIRPCLGCEHCIQHGACIHDDDLRAVVEKLQTADIWVFGTPVYFFGPSSQFKSFLDRWVGIPKETYAGKAAAYVVPLGAGSPEIAASTIDILERSMRLRGLRDLGGIVAPGLMDADEAKQDAELLTRTFDFGRTLLVDERTQ